MSLIATILSAVATLAVMVAIYAATTVKDPMAKRVKALNERREQLKAGIVASTNRRRSLTNKNEAADKVRGILTQFKMLQDDQLKKTQIKLMQAGIRTKDLAFFIIFARFILPLVFGSLAVTLLYGFDFYPEWGWLRRYLTVAGLLFSSYKAPDVGSRKVHSAAGSRRHPDASPVVSAPGRLTVAPRGPRRQGLARPIPSSAR